MRPLLPHPDPLRSLGHHLAAAQDLAYERRRADHAPARARFLMRVAAEDGRRRRTHRRVLLGAPLVFVGLVAFWGLSRRPPAEVDALTFVVSDGTPGATQAWIAAPGEQSLGLHFSDGSQIDLWPRSSARVLELRERGATIALEHGRADVEIEPHDRRRWLVEAGPFRIAVLGTGFSVEWEPESGEFRLDLHHGRVHVSGPTLPDARYLEPGEHVYVQSFAPEAEPSSPGAPPTFADEPDADEPDADEDVREAPSHGVPQTSGDETDRVLTQGANDRAFRTERPSGGAVEPATRAIGSSQEVANRSRGALPGDSEEVWLDSARSGAFDRALRQAEASGFVHLCATLPARQLLELADVARYARASARARQALLALRDRFPGSDAAATAAFDLGRLHAGDCTRARRWFEVYLAERPRDPMAVLAKRRLAECMRSPR